LPGTIVSIPEKTVVLSTQIPGQLQLVKIVESQRVRTGDDLLRFDDRSATIQRDKSHAVVDEARAIVARLKHGSRVEDIEAARQEVRRADTNLGLMRAKLESGQALIESKAIPQLEFAQRKAGVEAAEAEVATKKANLQLIEAGPRPEEIAEAEAKLASSEADLAASDLALKLTHVTAPIDGVVTDLPVRQGMFVSAGTTLLTLVDLSTLFARTRLPAVYLAQVREDARVDLLVASFPDTAFSGKVARIGKQADTQTGDVEAFALVPNPSGQLRPGLSCRLRLWLPEIPDALAIPVAAIADKDGTPVVTVVRDNKAHEIEVLLGGRTDKLVQIVGGIFAGDLVAVEGGYGLPDGCPCKVLLESSATSSSAPASPEMKKR
jgi:multidrug efflux pump subunit AcrA (membrane-fusion protein)